jgi:hypothetical protein
MILRFSVRLLVLVVSFLCPVVTWATDDEIHLACVIAGTHKTGGPNPYTTFADPRPIAIRISKKNNEWEVCETRGSVVDCYSTEKSADKIQTLKLTDFLLTYTRSVRSPSGRMNFSARINRTTGEYLSESDTDGWGMAPMQSSEKGSCKPKTF